MDVSSRMLFSATVKGTTDLLTVVSKESQHRSQREGSTLEEMLVIDKEYTSSCVETGPEVKAARPDQRST